MSSISEVEPVAIFPDRETSINKKRPDAYQQKKRQWLVEHGGDFKAAFNAGSVNVDTSPSIDISREFTNGDELKITIDLSYHDPKDYNTFTGYGVFRICYMLGGVEQDGPLGYGDLNDHSFEQLEILPEGLGLRLRRDVTDPRTITYVNALGNMIIETTTPFKG